MAASQLSLKDEAMVNNKNFFGVDINPIATLIAKTKCRKYDITADARI